MLHGVWAVCVVLYSRTNSAFSRLDSIRIWSNYTSVGGGYYLDKHPNSKIASFVKDAYEFFCFDVFCERSNKRFQEQFGGNNLFNDKIDCKSFLEDYFKIKF